MTAEPVTDDQIMVAVQAAQTADYDRLCHRLEVAKWTADHHPDLGIVDQWHRAEKTYRDKQQRVIELHRIALAQQVTAAVEPIEVTA